MSLTRPYFNISYFDVFVISVLASLLGSHSLIDYDLGWHLVSGFWTLDFGQVPEIDFISALNREWISYSWLADILFAAVFRYFDFSGLQLTQTLLISLSAISLYLWLKTVALNNGESGQSAIATILALPLIAPIWHLRPQLISLLLFLVLLIFLEKIRRPFFVLVALTIVWANVHVFWIFLPLVVFLYSTFEHRVRLLKSLPLAIALSTFGVLSPYTWKNLSVIFEYSFFHNIAYQLIDEFQPLNKELAFELLYFVSVVFLFLFSFKTQFKTSRRTYVCLFVVFVFLTFFQRKYLPFLGISTALVIQNVLPKYQTTCIRLDYFRMILMALLVSVITSRYFSSSPPIDLKTEEVLLLAESLENEKSIAQSEKYKVVLNRFDDGGWIALGFWLGKGESFENFRRLSIDGRTLVMGQDRLVDYSKLLQLDSKTCEIIEKWQTNLGLVPKDWKLTQFLLSGNCGKWQELKSTANWSILIRQD